jgi:hypothetical protein
VLSSSYASAEESINAELFLENLCVLVITNASAITRARILRRESLNQALQFRTYFRRTYRAIADSKQRHMQELSLVFPKARDVAVCQLPHIGAIGTQQPKQRPQTRVPLRGAVRRKMRVKCQWNH